MPSKPPNLKPAKARPNGGGRWDRRESRQDRGYGREHEAMRAIVLYEEPTCRECLKHDIITPSTIADHKIPKAEGGTDDRDNYQGLCDACSRKKTAREGARGRRRNRG